MPSVRKHPKSPYWTAIFLNERNVWQFKTTKRKEKSKALAMALEWERAARLGRVNTLTESLSREILDGILQRTTGEKLRSESLCDFCQRWLRGKESNKSAGTSTRYGGTVDKLLSFLERKADLPVSAVTPADCQKFYDHLAAQNL